MNRPEQQGRWSVEDVRCLADKRGPVRKSDGSKVCALEALRLEKACT